MNPKDENEEIGPGKPNQVSKSPWEYRVSKWAEEAQRKQMGRRPKGKGHWSPAEKMTPSLRVMQMQENENDEEVFAAERCEDLEGLDKRREKAQEHSCRYRND